MASEGPAHFLLSSCLLQSSRILWAMARLSLEKLVLLKPYSGLGDVIANTKEAWWRRQSSLPSLLGFLVTSASSSCSWNVVLVLSLALLRAALQALVERGLVFLFYRISFIFHFEDIPKSCHIFLSDISKTHLSPLVSRNQHLSLYFGSCSSAPHKYPHCGLRSWVPPLLKQSPWSPPDTALSDAFAAPCVDSDFSILFTACLFFPLLTSHISP